MKRPPKEKKNVRTRTEIYVDYTSRDGYRSEGDASKYEHEWSASRDLHVKNAWLSRDGLSSWQCETMQCEGKVQAGDTLYVIVVRYSDGDTFGQSTGNYHFELATKDANKAVEVKNAIVAGTYKRERPEDVDHWYDYLEWTGYFNSLEDVELHKMVVGK